MFYCHTKSTACSLVQPLIKPGSVCVLVLQSLWGPVWVIEPKEWGHSGRSSQLQIAVWELRLSFRDCWSWTWAVSRDGRGLRLIIDGDIFVWSCLKTSTIKDRFHVQIGPPFCLFTPPCVAIDVMAAFWRRLSVLHRCGRGSVTKAGLTSAFKCATALSDTRLLAPTLKVICCVCVFFFWHEAVWVTYWQRVSLTYGAAVHEAICKNGL